MAIIIIKVEKVASYSSKINYKHENGVWEKTSGIQLAQDNF